MEITPTATFVMPAYNAAPYISRAIESILAQTRRDWRLIVVNDVSTDDTRDIVMRHAARDPRIRLLDMPRPSGCAYQPRKHAIESAETEFVAPLDADDWIAPDYLEQLIRAREERDADAVYPTMYSVNEGNESEMPRRYLPEADFQLYDRGVAGHDCIKYTLDGWRMGFNGGLIRREAYLRAQSRLDADAGGIYADELLTRFLLPELKRVTVSEARYYYFLHSASVTHVPTARALEYLDNNIFLIRHCRERYGEDSEEYRLAQRQNFHGIFEAMRRINDPAMPRGEKRKAQEMVSRSIAAADLPYLRGKVSPRYHHLLRIAGLNARHLLRLLDPLIGHSRGHD
ncbi:MAG: glycosyltransferase [Muribaculaceae bacterium]|nr:glycosyltransferase [Muribaculaceae bacterium]